MIRRSAHVATACAVALIQLLVCIGFASDIVLCVAADGHIALEMPHAAGPCLTDFNRHHPGAPHLDTFDIDRHGCQDTLLSQPPAWRNEKTASARAVGPSAVAAISSPSRSIAPSTGPPTGLPGEVVAAARQLAALRTVVLLV
jgi:hypothetical protein